VVTFESHIPKSAGHELGASRNTVSMYCERYIRVMSEDSQVYLSKTEWSYLMDLASSWKDIY